MDNRATLNQILERNPDRVSGAWVFRGTRIPVSALFENLKDGASIDQFLEWFPGVTRAQVEALLDYELTVLNQLVS
ncbi:MAG: DUF433 domain-containing protein [Nodosilinea sp.]|jgi:uncharacterized protein (DUF433 family)